MKYYYLLIFSILLLFSCKENNQKLTPVNNFTVNKQELLEWNQKLVDINTNLITKLIERRKWNMNVSETGLYWQIVEKTNSEKVLSGKVVEFRYNIYLLSGEVMYSSENDGIRSLNIDKNQEEAGLNEGLKLMRLGEKARFILPPHLAFGVSGDGYKIPAYASLIYEVKIISIHEEVEKKLKNFDEEE
ncbi:MAG: FKBP-type peptidyl-prolyl cis-trans isomerase [Bacteroidales bacterium]|jgi:FKBP-type peptidyl-prolyl cis-trans isomerase|nr:FKBP-type peptidyl-prolyl cis-trans isomerase [Bacteroidales bacterium]